MFLKRNVYYRKIDKVVTLFDQPEEETIVPKNNFIIDKKVKIPFEKLDFVLDVLPFIIMLKK